MTTPHAVLDELVLEIGGGGGANGRHGDRVAKENLFAVGEKNEFVEHREILTGVTLEGGREGKRKQRERKREGGRETKGDNTHCKTAQGV